MFPGYHSLCNFAKVPLCSRSVFKNTKSHLILGISPIFGGYFSWCNSAKDHSDNRLDLQGIKSHLILRNFS